MNPEAVDDAGRVVVIAVKPNFDGQTAVDFALKHLVRQGSKVVLLHVMTAVPPPPPAGGFGIPNDRLG